MEQESELTFPISKDTVEILQGREFQRNFVRRERRHGEASKEGKVGQVKDPCAPVKIRNLERRWRDFPKDAIRLRVCAGRENPRKGSTGKRSSSPRK